MRLYKLFVLVMVAFVLATNVACSKSSLTAPSDFGAAASATSTVVMAPPPTGVSSEVWRVGFMMRDELLYRSKVVHVVLPPDTDPSTRALFEKHTRAITELTQGQTQMDTIPDPSGYGNFPVTLVAGLVCGGVKAGGCTSLKFQNGSGDIYGGKIEFQDAFHMSNEMLVVHELYRTLGMDGNSPKAGIFSFDKLIDWGKPYPSEEERLMILGRYLPPLLAKYSPKA